MAKLNKKVVIGIIALILVLVVVLSSVLISTSGNKYNKNKFNKTTVSCSGGQTQKDANLNKITLSSDKEALNINLNFVSGTSLEEVSPCKVPEYTVEFIESPLRLKITLKDMVYWDYMVEGMPEDETFLISGMFQQSAYNSNETTLYFSLSKSVKYKAIEQDNVLTVSLMPEKKDKQQDGWYKAVSIV